MSNSKRGPQPLPAALKRDYCVSVRFNSFELADVDTRRGQTPRGAWTRQAALAQKLPQQVPELNVKAWVELSRAASNLNQIAKHLNQSHGPQALTYVKKIKADLDDFRQKLLGVNHERNGSNFTRE